MATEPQSNRASGVHPTVDRLAAYSWRLLVIGAAALAGVMVLARVRVVLFPIVIATFLAVALTPVADFLRGRGLPRLAAVAATFILFFALMGAVGALIVPTVAAELGAIGPTVADATDSFERWLVQDLGVSQERLDDLRQQAASTARRSVSGAGALIGGAILIGEVIAGLVLSLFLAFFMVKDGHRFQDFALRSLPPGRRELFRRLGARAWRTLGGYLRGSAVLGFVEAVIIGVAMALTGASLVPAMMTITFLAAFFPFVGAVVAGVLATSITLVTAGVGPAVIIAVVAFAVQQLDGDFLAPIVFGKALDLHPVVVLLAVTTGGALGGLPGAILAVPVAALFVNVSAEAREHRSETGEKPLLA